MKIRATILASTLVFSAILASVSHAETGASAVVSSSGSVTAEMTADQLIEFYKKNKDYGKKRLSLDYQQYVEGDWVVLRGEYVDRESGKPIPNSYVIFRVNGKDYPAVTNESGVFNLEMKKSDVDSAAQYRVRMFIDHFAIQAPDFSGDALKKDSIYHFKVEKVRKGEQEFKLSVSTLHNAFFTEGEGGFEYQEQVHTGPSALGIQGVPFWLAVVILLLIGGFIYFKYKLGQSEKPYSRRYMKLERDPLD